MTLLFKRALAAAGFVIAVMAVAPASAQDHVRFVVDKKCRESSTQQPFPAAVAISTATEMVDLSYPVSESQSAQWLMKPVGNPENHTFELSSRATGELLVGYMTTSSPAPLVAVLAPDAQVPELFNPKRQTRPLSGQDTVWTIVPQPKPKNQPDAPATVLISKMFFSKEGGIGTVRYLGTTTACKLTFVELGKEVAWRLDNLGPATPPVQPDYVWLRRAGTTNAVHIETGAPQLGALGSLGWWSAQWEMKQVSSTAAPQPGVLFINRWTHKALARAGEALTTVEPPVSLSDLTSSAALWNVVQGSKPGVSLQNGDRFLALNGTGKLTMSKQDFNWLIEYRAPGTPAPVAAPAPEMIVQVLGPAGHVLNVEKGPVAIDADKPGDPNPPSHWWSGMWVVVDLGVDKPNAPRTQFFALRNRHTHKYLAVVDRQIMVVDAQPNLPQEQLSYAWTMPITEGSQRRPLQNLMSRTYLDVKADEPQNIRILKLSEQPAPIWTLKRLD